MRQALIVCWGREREVRQDTWSVQLPESYGEDLASLCLSSSIWIALFSSLSYAASSDVRNACIPRSLSDAPVLADIIKDVYYSVNLGFASTILSREVCSHPSYHSINIFFQPCHWQFRKGFSTGISSCITSVTAQQCGTEGKVKLGSIWGLSPEIRL